MNEEFDELDEDLNELIEKFENCLFNDQSCFFDSEDLLEIIDHYFASDSTQMAKSAVDFALSLYPNEIKFLIRQAQCISLEESPQKAIKILEEQREKTPNDDSLIFALATLYSQAGLSSKAINLYQYLLKLDDKDIETYILLGEEYVSTENYSSAVKVFKKALLISPTDESLLQNFAYAAQFLDDTESSVLFLKKLCEKKPFSEQNWIAYSNLLFNTENYFDAITALDLAIAINDKNADAYLSKAEAYISLENYSEAINCFHEALEIKPDEHIILFFLGDAYEKQNNFEKAIYYFKEATKKLEFFADAWLGLAMSYFEKNDFTNAEPNIKRAIELEPQNIHYKLTYAEMLYKENYISLSEDIYQSLYEEGEELAIVTINWAMAMVSNNRLMEAINLLRETIDNNKFEEPGIYFTLIELSSRESYLKDHLEDYLFRLLLNYDVSLKMLEEYCPSLLKNPNYETLIKTYINEKD
mgnify:FL=1